METKVTKQLVKLIKGNFNSIFNRENAK